MYTNVALTSAAVISAEHFGAKIFILRRTVPNISGVKLFAVLFCRMRVWYEPMQDIR